MPRHLEMEQIVEDIKSFAARGFPEREVWDYLSGSVVAPDSLSGYLSYREDRYTRHLIHKDRDFELMVICWGSGQKAPIHGHEGELCWARVERGCLRFTNYRTVSQSPLELALDGEPLDGTAGFLDGPAEIHAVDNLAEFGADAASLHLYSKPYSQCDVYDSERGPKRRVSLSYDTFQGQPVGPNAQI